MYNESFPDKTPAEKKIVTFNFAGEAAPDAILSAPVVAKALIDGNDTGAVLLLVSPPQIQGLNVMALVEDGGEMSNYGLLASASADNGELHQIGARMKVTVDAA